MTLEDRTALGSDEAPEIEEESRSFHDLLASRSNERLSRRKRDPFAGINWGHWFREVIAQTAIFAGGMIFGAGVMLLRLGEPIQGQAGLIAAVGLGIVLVTMLAKLLTRTKPRSVAQVARG